VTGTGGASHKPASRRPAELQDPLNRYLYHPLADRLARALVPTGISPNAVSMCGAVTIWAAAFAYIGLPGPWSVLLGLLLHMFWHVVDGADGTLARLTGRSSPKGEMVDGLCDYAGHFVLYVALATVLDERLGLWAWPFALLAAASHGLQANHSESQRRIYLWRVYGVPWIKLTGADPSVRRRSWAGRLVRLYLRLGEWISPHSDRVDDRLRRLLDDPERSAKARDLVRASSGRALLYEKWLGANPRALILGFSMALGSPLAFFLIECLLLNLLLLISVLHHSRRDRMLAARLDAISHG
jgi:hypothetical protein